MKLRAEHGRITQDFTFRPGVLDSMRGYAIQGSVVRCLTNPHAQTRTDTPTLVPIPAQTSSPHTCAHAQGVYANIDTTLCASYEWGGVRFTRIVHLTGTISATIQAFQAETMTNSKKYRQGTWGLVECSGTRPALLDGTLY